MPTPSPTDSPRGALLQCLHPDGTACRGPCCAWPALRERPHQLLAEVVAELGDDVHEAVERVRLGRAARRPVSIRPEVEVQRREQLVHALHVAQPRVELGEDEQRALHLLRREGAGGMCSDDGSLLSH